MTRPVRFTERTIYGPRIPVTDDALKPPEKPSFLRGLLPFLRLFAATLLAYPYRRVGPIGAWKDAKIQVWPRPLRIRKVQMSTLYGGFAISPEQKILANSLYGKRPKTVPIQPPPVPQIGDRWSYALDDGSFGETGPLVGVEGQNVLWIDEQGAGCMVPTSALVQRLLSPRKGEYWSYIREDGSPGLSFPISEVHSDGVEWIEESDWTLPRVPFSRLLDRIPDDIALEVHRKANRT